MKHVLLQAVALLLVGVAHAQTAGHVVVGTESTAGCPGSVVPCWVPSGPGSPSSVTIVGPTGPEGGISVSVNPFRTDATNGSGTITVGGAWQQALANNPLRQRAFIQNYCSAATQGISASESLFIDLAPTMPAFNPTQTAGAIELVTCGNYDTSTSVLNTQPVWLWATSVGHRFVALQW